MKWSIAGLLLLGIGAAVSASILVASFKLAPQAPANVSTAPKEVQMVVAARPIAAMTLVEAAAVSTKTVPAEEATDHCMRRPADVIGKLLMVPVVEGQVFTSTCFADEKSGARLASALANGMRAVSVSLKPEKAGLLYPGCIVDVLVALNRPSTEGSGTKEAMSMTLLQSVQILAIDDTSVMSDEAFVEPAEQETKTTPVRNERRDRLVTLMVNSQQAKALQLASQYGTVSLALRNPLDLKPVETESTMLSDLADEYTRIVAALARPQAEAAKAAVTAAGATPAVPVAAKMPDGSAAVSLKEAREQRGEGKGPFLAGALMADEPDDPKWELMVNRSGQIEMVRFRRSAGLWPLGVPQVMDWTWEGRALSNTSAVTKPK